jgi:hypothetical protein
VALDALAREGVAFRDAATMLGLSPAEIEMYGPVAPGPPAVSANPLQPTGQLPASSGYRVGSLRSLFYGVNRCE